MKPLEARLFKPLSKELKEYLLHSDVVPVNDIFLPLWQQQRKINLVYGSYGSGKSVAVVDRLIDRAINDEYFRCYYGRKVFESVRGSIFKTITDRIKELHKEYHFKFSEAPNGSMVIICRKNGNEFNPFGANNPGSLKSIKDPTHILCEEFDQFDYTDFGPMFSRLRTEKAFTEFFGIFNTEKVHQSHWLRVMFFDGQFADRSYKLKANYYHNSFIDQAAYYETLQQIANGNEAYLNAIAEGEWGMIRSGAEFLKQFSESKHITAVPYVPGAIYLSWDENVVPYVTCTIWQVRGKGIYQIKEVIARPPINNAPKAAEKVADWLQAIGHRDVVYVLGDPSASKRSTVDENNRSFYDKVLSALSRRGFKVISRVMKSAPQVALSGAFVNDILERNLYGFGIMIDRQCFTSIEDYLLAKEDFEGKMLKEPVKDKETGQTYQVRGHCTDTLRYLILTILAKYFDDYKQYRSKPIAGQVGYFG